MMRIIVKLMSIALGGASGCASLGWAQELSVEERFLAQEIIERFYYSHREGANAPFEHVISREVIESKVESHLRKSETLRQLWGIEVTDEMVREELDRIVRSTRMPQRLEALFQALENDLRAIQEALVRPILADRLIRAHFAADAGLHAQAKKEALTIREDLLRGKIDPEQQHPRRIVLELSAQDLEGHRRLSMLDPLRRAGDVRLVHAAWLEDDLTDLYRSLKRTPGRSIGLLSETARAFLIPVVLRRNMEDMRVAVFAVEKQSWDEWWNSVQTQFDVSLRVNTKEGSIRGDGDRAWLAESTPTCGQSDTWSALPATANSPSARAWHTSVWTGSEMIIWGGVLLIGDTLTQLNTGARYDPTLDIWVPTTMVNAPMRRWLYVAIWTGDKMIVWGGEAGSNLSNTGSLYDPVSDSWTATSTVDAPSPRENATAVWTGDVMIVWGGTADSLHRIGGRYDPASDTWEATALLLSPQERLFHTAVWTGTHMIIWGGAARFSGVYLDTGGLYDPILDVWSVTSTSGAPSARAKLPAVWTGNRMIVWGGQSDLVGSLDSGGQYDPIADSWTPTSLISAPSPRFGHTAVWTGDSVLVWGGSANGFLSTLLNTGGHYDPTSDSWTAMTTVDAPEERVLHTAEWAGDLMLVWGGQSELPGSFDDGGAYCNCTMVAYFADTDSDGFGDDSTMISSCSAPPGYVQNNGDCDDSDGTIWSAPSEVNGLMLPDPATLTWAPPASPGGTQPLYDVLRTSDPADFMTAATCVSSDDPLTSTTHAQDPALGAAFFYDIRAETGCPGGGQGPLGSDSNGIPRMGRSCP
jgi:hypothetical protein